MKLSKSRTASNVAFNITPMIDIVFLLIIFFMTVSQITRTVDHPVALPVVSKGGADAKPSTVTINLDKTGKIIVAGKQMKRSDVIDAVYAQLESRGFDTTRLRIQIRCDRECQSEHVNRLLDRLSEIGFKQVNVAVSKS